MNKFVALYDFVDRAVKNRKYPSNTAHGMRAALRMFEVEINEEEKASIDKFRDNLDQIYQSVSIKNKDVAASSLMSYKSRVSKVLKDYERYGVDPTKMANWSVKTIVRQRKEASTESRSENSASTANKNSMGTSADFIFDFQGGIKLIIPRTKATSEAIADGELKKTRTELAEFAKHFMDEPQTEKTSDTSAS